MLRANVRGGTVKKCMNYVVVLIGAMEIVVGVAAAAENISSVAPFNSIL